MKTFFKIAAVVVGLLIVILVGLNIYFTDDRLSDMVLPDIREATGADIQVDKLSLTFFRTFPRFGVEAQHVQIPDQMGDSIFSADQILVSVELFPLLRNELSVSRLDLKRPVINYQIRPDSTTNIDFLLESDSEVQEETGSGFDISIPRFSVSEGSLLYADATNESLFKLDDLDADISLRFADLIESSISARLGELSATVEGVNYVENLSLSLDQTSTIDLQNEILTLTEATLSIRGLALNLAGSVTSWSSDFPTADLEFSSSSDSFEELLRLAPPQFEETIEGLESRGSLTMEGSVTGPIGGDVLPAFNLIVEVNDGYLKNPDLSEAIRDIILNLEINNELATIREFRATAAGNTVYLSGTLERPMEDDAVFDLTVNGDVDLSTIGNFYPISDFGLEDLAGVLQADATANGRLDVPEEASFSGVILLENGRLKYADVPQPIEEINARIDARNDRLLIRESGFRTSSGSLSLSGSVVRPLDEESRLVDIAANLNMDLASVKEFYPLHEDTLSMRGDLSVNVSLQGRPDPENIESLVRDGRAELKNGFISHYSIAKPIEQISFLAEASGTSLTINRADFEAGDNSLTVSGSVDDYLSERPSIDLMFDGDAVFADITTYYSLEPWIQEITGSATMRMNVSGPVGDPKQISLNGSLAANEVNAYGDSLGLPVTDLNGLLTIRPASMSLDSLGMNYGSTDISLQGTLNRYLGFLEESNESEESMPQISGSYRSEHLNMDEMIDWEEESEGPIPVEIPDMLATVDAEIDSLTIFGLRITDISGSGSMNPRQILLEEANARLFGGTANGSMNWQVPDPLRTNVRFEGSLDTLRAEDFFRDTGFLGKDRNLHNHVSGALNVSVDYYAELDEELSPDITTAEADGSFGMTRSSLEGHPIQVKIAEFLRAPRLERANLDQWEADFAISDTVLTLSNLSLTSDSIGVEMNGTQHLMTNRIDYVATLLLPASFKGTIASVISTPAADALQQENGAMGIPIRITGTTGSPVVRPDTRVIEEVIRERAREGAEDVLKRLFNRNGS
ncbi:AsmA-like C-terminal region-containing protein [Rhodohalobacter mucosus]|uniref:AsmA domain-containing protein n=1 Tax=Rhodohalobacter mucosus TaxID=2079485 RepID=A0A316TZA7_9BACT|nr:AsmA-like C-terminal region-containing protein [Rhodohalobacter mucosus]PWN05376.1 hypothetical protein DDZ15_15020 [Rhodohalobacter mucosus]